MELCYKCREEEKPQRERNRESYLKRKYNISNEIYQKLLNKQEGLCAICRGNNNGKILVVDHDHSSGKARGLLCTKCNVIVGILEVDKFATTKALDYLLKWQTETAA